MGTPALARCCRCSCGGPGPIGPGRAGEGGHSQASAQRSAFSATASRLGGAPSSTKLFFRLAGQREAHPAWLDFFIGSGAKCRGHGASG